MDAGPQLRYLPVFRFLTCTTSPKRTDTVGGEEFEEVEEEGGEEECL
jgi:hypothetical protein